MEKKEPVISTNQHGTGEKAADGIHRLAF